MPLDFDPYQTLGVAPSATPEQIRAAFRRRCKQCHPDAGGTHEEMTALLNASEVLSDPARRAVYDRARTAAPGTSTVAADAGCAGAAAAPAGSGVGAEQAAWSSVYDQARAAAAAAAAHLRGRSWQEVADWMDAKAAGVQSRRAGRAAAGALAGAAVGAALGVPAGWALGTGPGAGLLLGSVAGALGGTIAAVFARPQGRTPAA